MLLLQLLNNKKVPDSYELKLLEYSLKYGRENIARGHLEKFVKDYKININWYADSKIFFDFVSKMKLPKKVYLINEKINLKLIDRLVERPIILYLDRFYLWKRKWGLYYRYHYPHFVIVTRKEGNFYEIIDPDDGIMRKITSKSLSKSIISLRNYLYISPQIVCSPE